MTRDLRSFPILLSFFALTAFILACNVESMRPGGTGNNDPRQTSTAIVRPTLTAAPSSTSTLAPTVTPTSIFTSTPTPIPCSPLITPENNSKVYDYINYLEFSWQAMPGAQSYLLKIVQPSDLPIVFITPFLQKKLSLSAIRLGGEYIWSVTPLDGNGDPICTSDPFTFWKAAYGRPTKPPRDEAPTPTPTPVPTDTLPPTQPPS